MNARLRLQVKPDWRTIDAIRDKLAWFLRDRKLSRDVVDAVAMVGCELLENAVKYGAFEPPANAIALEVAVGPSAITVEVAHPVGPDELESVLRLDGTIQWIRGFQDPFEAYLERLKDVSAQTLDSLDSGLGLVRIAYEGQSTLDCCLDGKRVLAVSAVRDLNPAQDFTETT